MSAPTANWIAANADLTKQPVYIVRFAGYTGAQFASGPVKSPTLTTKLYLSDVDGLGHSADPISGRFSAGTLTFMIVDKNNEITALLNGTIYQNQRVLLMIGYAGLAETDYLKVPGGFLTKFELKKAAVYEFTCGDPRRAAVEDAFTNADSSGTYFDTQIETAVTAGKHVINVPSVNVFDPITNAPLLNEGDKLFLKNAAGQEEQRTVRKLRSGGGTGEIVLNESLVYSYGVGDSVRWATTRFAGSAMSCVYAMLTGCFARESSATVSLSLNATAAAGQKVIPLASTSGLVVGDGYFIQRGLGDAPPQEVVVIDSISPGISATARDNLKNTYFNSDILFSAPLRLTSFSGMPTGLPLASYEVDDTGMAAERDDWLWGLTLSFEIDRAQTAKSFLEREIFRLFGYPILTLDGMIGFKAYAPRKPNAAVATLSETNIVSWSWRRRFDLSYNRLVMKYGYDIQNDNFTVTKIVEDTADQAASGVRELVLELKGVLSTDFNGIYLDTYAKRFLQRYMQGVPEITVQAHLTRRALQIGDSVELTHSQIPNFRTAARGIAFAVVGTPCWEVIKIEPGFNDGAFTLTLQDNGYKRPGFIAPAGQPDYGGASTAQKKYAYISPPALANFADGTQPYTVI